ncbi:Ig-like domain-containing protein [bacterium]|nr:Ig-like domain-containing protein [bacterium]
MSRSAVAAAACWLLTGAAAASTVDLTWNANSEDDLAGYKIYYGTQSRNYHTYIDVGNVTEYTVPNLEPGVSYYICLTAYDINRNESSYSEEIFLIAEDNVPPEIESVSCLYGDQVRVVFNEIVDMESSQLTSNYAINNGIAISKAQRQSDKRTILLSTNQHANGEYLLTVSNVRDSAAVPNAMPAGTEAAYVWSGNDEDPPEVESVELLSYDLIAVTFSEPVDQSSAVAKENYAITPSLALTGVSIDGSCRKVYLVTEEHQAGQTYTLTINHIRDNAVPANEMNSGTAVAYTWQSDDTEPPTLVSARSLTATSLAIEFSEPLDAQSAEAVGNYLITPAVAVSRAQLSAAGTVVTLTTGTHAGGTYTVKVSNVTDDASPPNTIVTSQLSYIYNAPDVTPPRIAAVAITSANLVKVTFDEPVSPASATYAGNYSISPYVKVTRASLDISEKVVMLETEGHAAATYTLTVSGVQDKAAVPNTIAANTTGTYTYQPPDVTRPTIVAVQMHGNDIVELVFSEAVERTSAEIAANYQISGSIAVQSAALVGDAYTSVYLSTSPHTNGQSYTVTVSNIIDRATVPNVIIAGMQASYRYVEDDTAPPRLTGVEQLGSSVIRLTFSEALNPQTVQTSGNYVFNPALSVASVSLDNTGKIVFLTTEEHQQGVQYRVTVSGVADLASPENVIGTENSLTFTTASVDAASPLLVRAESRGNQTVEIIFNEPVDPETSQNAANYTIDGGVTVIGVQLSQSQMSVFLETSAQPRGTYTVTVSNVRDQAAHPNTIAAGSQLQYTYIPADTEKPLLTGAYFINVNAVELTFNEPLNRESAENKANYAINNSITVQKATLDYAGTRVILQTSTHFPATFRVTVNNIKDGSAAGNVILPNTGMNYSYVVQDYTPPRIVSAILKDKTHLLVTYDEAMDIETAADPAHYQINNGIQVIDAVSIVSSASRDTMGTTIPQSQILLETSSHAAGQYLLTVNGVRDNSDAQNPIAAYSQIQYIWSPVDTTAPALNGAALVGTTNLQLTFSEPLDAETAKNKDNYVIQPYVEIVHAVLDAELDVVLLSTAQHDAGTYTVFVSNVKDRAFVKNTIGTANQAVYTYSPPDTVAPGLASVEMKESAQMVYLHFDEPLARTAAENVANYQISPNITVSNAYLHASLTTVMLETSTHQANTNYEIVIQGLKDRAPAPNTMQTSIRRQYTYTPPDNIRPELVSVKLQSPRKLELVFSEPIEKTSAETRSNYRIDPDIEVNHAYLDPVNMKLVTLETSDHAPGLLYSINAQNIRDRASIPNVITGNQWLSYSLPISGGSADQTAPAVARIDVISATKLDVIFTEPVDSGSAEATTNYHIEGGAQVKTADIDDQLTRVHLTTTEHVDGRAYAITVSNIRDLATTPNLLSTSPQTKYLIKSGVGISRLNRDAYAMNGFCMENSCYVDRDYLFEQIPVCLENTVQIQTSNDDKADTSNYSLTFELSGDAIVYVAYDSRIRSLPAWLADWKRTGEQVLNSRSDIYNVYSQEVNSGYVSLGGNYGGLDDNMYMVFVKPMLSSNLVLSGLSRTGYQVKRLGIGDRYYLDRDYTLASVPSFMENMFWINTANDDKTDDSDTFLSFTLLRSSVIYIAYDAMAGSTPEWMDDWMPMEDQIVDSRGIRFDVYTRSFPEGDVVLGGNSGTLDDNMYLVLLNPELTEEEDDESSRPATFNLVQNYPNPFNPETTIRFEIHKTGPVKLTVINILGQRVKVLVDETVSGGTVREVVWDGTDINGMNVASGVYFYRIQQGQFAKTRRMILLR